MKTQITTIREERGYRLVAREDGRRTVVQVAVRSHRVYDAMPGDARLTGGRWCAHDTPAGVEYVATWYSTSYANRVYRRLVADADESEA